MLRALCFTVLLSAMTFAQEKHPEVHLNHAFIVPDAETYEAIRNSEFVKQFAVWEERTTHRKDITYTGFYLYGRHTYFEFLKPDERTRVGDSKIAFGLDRTGDLDLLQKRAEAAGMKTEVQTITRAFKGKDVNWFRSLKRKDEANPSIGIWTLEYVPTFLSEWNPRADAKPSVRREDVLKRYAEVVKQDPTKKLLLDLKAITFRIKKSSLESAKAECTVLGFAMRIEPTHLVCSKDGEVTLRFLVSDEPPGITVVEFSVNKPLKDIVVRGIGNTSVKQSGRTVGWYFTVRPDAWKGRPD